MKRRQKSRSTVTQPMKGQDLRVLSGKTIYIALESWEPLPNEYPWKVLGTDIESLKQYVVKGVYGKYTSKTDHVYVYCEYFKTTYYVDIGWVRTWGSTNIVKPGKILLTHEAIESLSTLRRTRKNESSSSSSANFTHKRNNKRNYQSISQQNSNSSSAAKSPNVQTSSQRNSNNDNKRRNHKSFEEPSPSRIPSSSSSSSSSILNSYRQSPVAVIGAKARKPSFSSSSPSLNSVTIDPDEINVCNNNSSSSNSNTSSSTGRLDYQQFIKKLTQQSIHTTETVPNQPTLTVTSMWDRLKTIYASDASPTNTSSSISIHNSNNENHIDDNNNDNHTNNNKLNSSSSINIGIPVDTNAHRK